MSRRCSSNGGSGCGGGGSGRDEGDFGGLLRRRLLIRAHVRKRRGWVDFFVRPGEQRVPQPA